MWNVKTQTEPRGFTLIELLLVLVMVGLLGSLAMPVFKQLIKKAESGACVGNLSQIGISVMLAAQDTNRFPTIETDPSNPVYPEEEGAKGLLETLEPYGIEERHLRCVTDVNGPNHFARTGSSYEWRPILDGAPVANPKVYGRWGSYNMPLSRVRLVSDFGSVHNGRQNLLYADGHTRGF